MPLKLLRLAASAARVGVSTRDQRYLLSTDDWRHAPTPRRQLRSLEARRNHLMRRHRAVYK